MHNKKALVVALGAALAIQGVWAQKKDKPEPDSVVELYGKVYPELVFPSSSGATSESTTTCTICTPAAGENAIVKRTEMESSNSRFGVRGHERLSPNMKAIWQLETQFLVDSNNTAFAVIEDESENVFKTADPGGEFVEIAPRRIIPRNIKRDL